VVSWFVFRLKHGWAPMLGDPKIGRSPRTRESRKERNSRK
jgi:hypothetical protein